MLTLLGLPQLNFLGYDMMVSGFLLLNQGMFRGHFSMDRIHSRYIIVLLRCSKLKWLMPHVLWEVPGMDLFVKLLQER